MVEMTKVNIKLPKEVKDWCQTEAEKYAIPMSGYMAMILTKNKEQVENVEVLKEMNGYAKEMKNLSADGEKFDSMDFMKDMKGFMEQIKMFSEVAKKK